jgi:hypothetical protein
MARYEVSKWRAATGFDFASGLRKWTDLAAAVHTVAPSVNDSGALARKNEISLQPLHSSSKANHETH